MSKSQDRRHTNRPFRTVAKQSDDLLAQRIEALQHCFPEAFSEGKVDFERLRAALGDTVDDGPERYSFTWAGKRDALRLLQMPTRATLLPCPGESLDWGTTQNVFIEGDNLEVLKLLLRPYYGRVKMIYIDPPYNTGKDFIYRDDYRDPLGAYLQMTGQRDEAGNLLTSNPETSGRYHSAWLSMMYPRLFLARQLLREDGVIFVSIDHHEVHNLRMLMNEVFGEENFVSQTVWISNLKGRQITQTGPVGTHEYLVCFARDATTVGQFRADTQALKQLMPDIYRAPDYELKYDEHGPCVTKNELYNTNSAFNEITAPTMVFNIHHNFSTGETRVTDVDDPTTYPGFVVARPHPNARSGIRYHAWRWSREKVLRDSSELEFRLVNGELRIYTKVREFASMAVKDVILGPSTETGQADLGGLGLDGVFDTPKPVGLIKLLVTAAAEARGSVADHVK